eukprot:SAG11_NODE_243_length_11749_cov_33.422918_10_plen_83_part_00
MQYDQIQVKDPEIRYGGIRAYGQPYQYRRYSSTNTSMVDQLEDLDLDSSDNEQDDGQLDENKDESTNMDDSNTPGATNGQYR